MRILDRYLVRSLAPPWVTCLGLFLFLFMIVDLFGRIGDIVQYHIPVLVFAQYYLAMIPIVIVQVLPFACLLATMFVLSGLSKSNELVAMRASGINLLWLLQVFGTLGLVMSMAAFVINEKWVPKAAAAASFIKEEEMSPQEHGARGLTLKDVAVIGRERRIYYVAAYDVPAKTLQKLVVLEHNPALKPITKWIADKATYQDGKWKFVNLIVYQFDAKQQIIGEPRFYREKLVDLPETPRDFLHQEAQTEYMSIRQLAEHIHRLHGTASSTLQKLWVDLLAKTAQPFACLVMILLGIPSSLQFQRSGAARGVAEGILLSFAYYGVNAIGVNLGKGGFFHPFVAAWMTNAIFLGVAWRRFRSVTL